MNLFNLLKNNKCNLQFYNNISQNFMLTKENIIELIYDAFDEINDNLPNNKKLVKTEDEKIFGQAGKLDSLGLVNLIVQIETLLYEKFDVLIVLADEKAMSLQNSPFRDVSSLSNYIFSIAGNN